MNKNIPFCLCYITRVTMIVWVCFHFSSLSFPPWIVDSSLYYSLDKVSIWSNFICLSINLSFKFDIYLIFSEPFIKILPFSSFFFFFLFTYYLSSSFFPLLFSALRFSNFSLFLGRVKACAPISCFFCPFVHLSVCLS